MFQNYGSIVSYGVIRNIKLGAIPFDSNIIYLKGVFIEVLKRTMMTINVPAKKMF